MADNLPSRRIDRAALEKIIQRATELQAGELDTGESLTEAELLKLGADVGIDGRYLRQALYEQGSGTSAETGYLVRWFGPQRVSAGRVVSGTKLDVELSIAHWMTEGEALTVKRPDCYFGNKHEWMLDSPGISPPSMRIACSACSSGKVRPTIARSRRWRSSSRVCWISARVT